MQLNNTKPFGAFVWRLKMPSRVPGTDFIDKVVMGVFISIFLLCAVGLLIFSYDAFTKPTPQQKLEQALKHNKCEVKK